MRPSATLLVDGCVRAGYANGKRHSGNGTRVPQIKWIRKMAPANSGVVLSIYLPKNVLRLCFENLHRRKALFDFEVYSQNKL
jgi:hypothetical protein